VEIVVRIWCVPIELLDRQHLLGEHNELLVILNSIIRDRQLKTKFVNFMKFLESYKIHVGWINHPQTCRFKNCVGQLIDRHNQQAREMQKRGYKHNTPLTNIGYLAEPYSFSESEYKKDFMLLMSRQHSS